MNVLNVYLPDYPSIKSDFDMNTFAIGHSHFGIFVYVRIGSTAICHCLPNPRHTRAILSGHVWHICPVTHMWFTKGGGCFFRMHRRR